MWVESICQYVVVFTVRILLRLVLIIYLFRTADCLVHISSVAAMYETQIANFTVAQAYATSWNQRTSIYDTKKTNEISNKNCFICTSYSHFVPIVIQYQAPYDTIRDVVLTCAQKLTYVSLIYWTEPKNKKWKKEELKSKYRFAQKYW